MAGSLKLPSDTRIARDLPVASQPRIPLAPCIVTEYGRSTDFRVRQGSQDTGGLFLFSTLAEVSIKATPQETANALLTVLSVSSAK